MKLLQIGASGRQEEVEVPGVGAAIGDWSSYTPVIYGSSNLGAGGGAFFKYRREGDSVRIRGTITVGTGGSITSTIKWTLPAGLTAMASKFPADSYNYMNVGTATVHDSGTSVSSPYTIIYVDGTNNRFQALGQRHDGAWGFIGASNFPMTWAPGDQLFIDMLVPVNEWQANINLAQDFVEYVSCDGTEASSGVAANTTYTPATTNRLKAGSLFPAVAISATNSQTITTYNLDFETPILDSDKIFIEVSVGNDVWLPLICGMGTLSQYSQANGVHTGMLLSRTSTNNKRISVRFSNAGTRPGPSYGTGQNTWSDARTSGWKWRVTKIGGRFSENGTDGYSTGETLTNKTWIDGKPIYRKVVDLGTLPNTTSKSVAHGASVSAIVGFDAYMYQGSMSSNQKWKIPYAYNGTDNISVDVGPANVVVSTRMNWSTHSAMAIIEYTK